MKSFAAETETAGSVTEAAPILMFATTFSRTGREDPDGAADVAADVADSDDVACLCWNLERPWNGP